MRSAFVFSFALLSVLSATGAAAQAIITPTSPTSNDVITARSDIFTLACTTNVQTNVTGTTIRTDISLTGCITGPPPFILPVFATFGPLPPGSYTYEVYTRIETDPPTLVSSQTIVVSALVPLVPTASEWALVILAAALGVVAVVSLGLTAR